MHLTMPRALPLVILAANLAPAQPPTFRAVDLAIGATERVNLPGGQTATVKLLSTAETRDRVRSAIRDARVTVEINGTPATLSCGNYRLPVQVSGLQADCEVTKALPRHQFRPLGPPQRRPPPPLARRRALHAPRLFRLSRPPALVRHAHPNGQRAHLCR